MESWKLIMQIKLYFWFFSIAVWIFDSCADINIFHSYIYFKGRFNRLDCRREILRLRSFARARRGRARRRPNGARSRRAGNNWLAANCRAFRRGDFANERRTRPRSSRRNCFRRWGQTSTSQFGRASISYRSAKRLADLARTRNSAQNCCYWHGFNDRIR